MVVVFFIYHVQYIVLSTGKDIERKKSRNRCKYISNVLCRMTELMSLSLLYRTDHNVQTEFKFNSLISSISKALETWIKSSRQQTLKTCFTKYLNNNWGFINSTVKKNIITNFMKMLMTQKKTIYRLCLHFSLII